MVRVSTTEHCCSTRQATSEAPSTSVRRAHTSTTSANAHARRDDLSRAIDDYTKAIAIDANLAEAYYNRGLVHLRKKETEKAVADLSKAGERGLYKAYGIIKKYGQK